MCKRQDIRRSDSIVTSGKGSSAAVGCDIDRSDLPPLVVRNAPMFVILQIIFNDYFRKPKICCTQTRTVIAPLGDLLRLHDFAVSRGLRWRSQPKTVGSSGCYGLRWYRSIRDTFHRSYSMRILGLSVSWPLPPCETEGDTFWGHHYAVLGRAITTEDDRACDHITRVG